MHGGSAFKLAMMNNTQGSDNHRICDLNGCLLLLIDRPLMQSRDKQRGAVLALLDVARVRQQLLLLLRQVSGA